MRTPQARLSIFVLGAGLSMASGAWADVTLLSQTRSLNVVGTGGTVKSDATTGTADWSSNKLFYQSGANGYWNGAYQYSTFLPDGSTGLGQSMMAQGAAKSVRFGTFAPTTEWTASNVFESTFRVGATSQLMDITMSIQASGVGSSVLATLTKGGSTVWSYSANGDDLQTLTLASGDYVLRVAANSKLTTGGVGGDAQYNLGVGFTPIPGPSALVLVSLNAFLRRRRT